jgi:hypothetical protein
MHTNFLLSKWRRAFPRTIDHKPNRNQREFAHSGYNEDRLIGCKSLAIFDDPILYRELDHCIQCFDNEACHK